jgi:hypothetical protein
MFRLLGPAVLVVVITRIDRAALLDSFARADARMLIAAYVIMLPQVLGSRPQRHCCLSFPSRCWAPEREMRFSS